MDGRNPFSLAFGKEPAEYISRDMQIETIKDTFIDGDSGSQAYMITGLRGTGKTVLLSDLNSQFSAMDDWITVDLNPNRDMLTALISKLNSHETLKKLFANVHLSFSLMGISVSYGGDNVITDPEAVLEKMLFSMKDHGRKLLVTVDEVNNNENMRIFAGTFQMMIRKNLPFYLLMTGLYENVADLQNQSSMTFLLRTPKTELTSLNRTGMTAAYMRSCEVNEQKAKEMADLTRGYAFAFQLLGYLFWREKKNTGSQDLEPLMPEFDQKLEEYVYAKIWSGLSETDRRYAAQISKHQEYRVKDLLSDMSVTNSQYSVYRSRLASRGLIDISKRGYVSIALPRFYQFVQHME